jgi:hypothetical protein
MTCSRIEEPSLPVALKMTRILDLFGCSSVG